MTIIAIDDYYSQLTQVQFRPTSLDFLHTSGGDDSRGKSGCNPFCSSFFLILLLFLNGDHTLTTTLFIPNVKRGHRPATLTLWPLTPRPPRRTLRCWTGWRTWPRCATWTSPAWSTPYVSATGATWPTPTPAPTWWWSTPSAHTPCTLKRYAPVYILW